MSKEPSAKRKRSTKPELELDPDAWPKFERFIKDVAKAGPQHRQAPKPRRRALKPKHKSRAD